MKKSSPSSQVVKNIRPNRLWRLHLVEYLETPNVDANRQGIRDGLVGTGLVEGRDYTLQIHNAQGDMATINSIVDAVTDKGCDILLASTTPSLQVAIQKVKRLPVVFSLVANPMMAGAGRTPEDHLPNITGTYVISPNDEMMSLLKQWVPPPRRIGSLFTPSEVNSVYYKDLLVEAADKAGIGLELVGVSSSQEVADAALALSQRKIDLFCQISDNLSGASFAGIALAGQRAHLPLFSFSTGHSRQGAILTLARDFYEGGRESALMAVRIIQGEKPSDMPFKKVAKINLVVNLDTARRYGISVPDSIRKQADKIIDQGKD